MTLKEKVLGGLVFLFVLIGTISSFISQTWFEGFYVREDGPIEWVTVVVLLTGMGVCWYRAAILKSFRPKIFIFSLIGLGLLYLFGAGEEISWGQRILGIKSPEFFQKHNSQMETNLHNLILGGVRINRVFFGTILGICVAFYVLILPYLYDKVEWLKKRVDQFALPLPKLPQVLLYASLGLLVYFTPSGKKGELLEFAGCWVFLFITLWPKNREIFSRKSFER